MSALYWFLQDAWDVLVDIYNRLGPEAPWRYR